MDSIQNMFRYKNTSVDVIQHYIGALPKRICRSCFCCNKPMTECDIVLLINNDGQIPNTSMHTTCFAQWQDKTDELCDDIVSAYNQWKLLNGVWG